MPTVCEKPICEFDSGEVVEPGVYQDIETGSVVQIQERDSLPEGVRVIHYTRHFRRIDETGAPAHN